MSSSRFFIVLLLANCGSPDERAQRYYEHGIKLLSEQNYIKANIEFRNALQLKQDLVGAWRGLAQIEERNKNWEPLSAILRTIVELDPNDADAKLKLGRLLLAGNVLDQAFDLINAAAQIDNRSASILAVKAAILLKLNDSSGAKREAQAALEIDPSNAEAVPFTVHIPEAERDPDLPGKLETEWPAILHWAIDGCLEWQRIGLAPPSIVRLATRDYFDAEDILGHWLEEECDVEVNNEFKWEPVADLFESWSAFATKGGDRPGSKNEFSEAMQNRGFERCKKAGKRSLSGVRLRPKSGMDADGH
jgi:tetratricopeptide (TPR) repeat protein